MSAGFVGGKPVVNISGPSLAAYYGLDWFVRPIVAHCLSVPPLRRQKVTGILAEDLSYPPRMEILCRVQVRRSKGGGYVIYPCSRDNTTMSATLTSNALYINKLGETGYKKGDMIEVELLRSEEYLTE
jgi:molybdopterin molybdotransferase/putative molybdopterin biosynthesis protein